ncbi:TPA: TRAP transporter substrate-binding protein [Vibrio cholerae]|uniref:TRAP transporter substrate-binding protein n=1 Tax=Vibrio fluvialis TaxID=676 RepID=UPI001C9CF899|nr:TRAP transporter substrate-binding protein [Vibrio fluvialis]EKF9172873.1 TRAP transporter substrate-binding protein [Vibrio cholerae]MBY7771317.1 TRAP transporter substrate-binding protein [Vibrio fluvialis]MBY7817324.1 TRAP transporter substrate-binding protein [Vibrio fluvialis]MBY8089616.1 TRAP transporter substrate-binding protein [Vibrio fluvialis]MBY8095872.1 TRAP transporter substrate-binding protein [Vibrio fluvialis]
MRKIATLSAALTCMVSLPSLAETTIRIAHDSQPGSPLFVAFEAFEQDLETRSNGDIQVEIYGAGQLGGVRETTEMVQANNLQMTTAASVLLSPIIPQFNVLDTFYMFEDRAHAHRVLDSDAGQALLSSMDEKGFKGLGYLELGFRSFTNNEKPLKNLEDFKNLKIRSAANPTQIQAWRSAGLSPMPLAWGEIYTSLQQGLIGGQESAIDSIYTQRFYEVQKYLSLTEHMYSNHVLFTNTEFWEQLSDSDKALVEQSIETFIANQRTLAEEQNQATLATLKDAGVNVNSVPTETREQLKQALNSAVMEEIKAKTGDELYTFVMQKTESLR